MVLPGFAASLIIKTEWRTSRSFKQPWTIIEAYRSAARV